MSCILLAGGAFPFRTHVCTVLNRPEIKVVSAVRFYQNIKGLDVVYSKEHEGTYEESLELLDEAFHALNDFW